jgi:hypothetical protein
MASNPLTARPPKSEWVVRMPVSMMYACTFDAVLLYVYALSSGRLRWSSRSRPYDGGLLWVSLARCTTLGCTYDTAGSAASRRACVAVIVAAKPRSACEYVRSTRAPCRPATEAATPATAVLPSLSTTT